MTIIGRITSRVAKIMNGDKRAGKIEDLIMQAFEAGRQDGIKDVMITLTDDMINADHSAAIQMINANY